MSIVFRIFCSLFPKCTERYDILQLEVKPFMKFGDRLRMLREEKDITQKQLGDIINVSDRVIGYYESNDRFPKDEEILRKIADFFNVSSDWLLGRSENRNLVTEKTNIPNDINELAKTDPELLKEMCRAKNLPEEARKRLREMASYEIEKYYWEQQHKKK